MTTITERVAAGAAFLDEHDPDWWREHMPNAINLDTLGLESGSRCVLGQRCPLEAMEDFSRRIGAERDSVAEDRYWAYAYTLSGLVTVFEVEYWATHHGFTRGESETWGDLTSAWWVLINERRKLAAYAS